MDRRYAALAVTLATVMAFVATATAAAQDRDAFLAGQSIKCPGCDLSGANLDRRDLTGADLSGANLRGATFSRTILRGANLAGADLAGAPFKRHDLAGTNLSAANLEGATLHRAVLRGANLSGANLAGANLNAAVLTSANLQRAKLSQALLFQIEAGGATSASTSLRSATRVRARMSVSAMECHDWMSRTCLPVTKMLSLPEDWVPFALGEDRGPALCGLARDARGRDGLHGRRNRRRAGPRSISGRANP